MQREMQSELISPTEKQRKTRRARDLVKSVLAFALIMMLLGIICACIVIQRGNYYGSKLDVSIGGITLGFFLIFFLLFVWTWAEFGSFANAINPVIEALSEISIKKILLQQKEIEMTSLHKPTLSSSVSSSSPYLSSASPYASSSSSSSSFTYNQPSTLPSNFSPL